MGEPCDGSSVDDHNDDINANTDSDDGGDGASEEDKGVDDQDGDKLDLENDFEEDGDNLDDRKEDADGNSSYIYGAVSTKMLYYIKFHCV